jgi:hypothetical protein
MDGGALGNKETRIEQLEEDKVKQSQGLRV